MLFLLVKWHYHEDYNGEEKMLGRGEQRVGTIWVCH
jgi:hypothetical protein